VKTVLLSEETAPRHYRVEMYAGDTERLSVLLEQIPTSVSWQCNGGTVVDDGSVGRHAYALFTLNDSGGNGEISMRSSYADGTRRTAHIEVKALGTL
jgi:hypothetical protein